jgi:EAL domain-containing protein (putative c-di-GMP-specific phosphodiesterase class I)
MNRSAAHHCVCQTTRRTAAVVLNTDPADLDGFERVASQLAISSLAELGMLTFEIKTGGTFESAGVLRNFLETHWPDRAPHFRVCWIREDRPIASQLAELASAMPLTAWATDVESPLRTILDQRRIDSWFQPIFQASGLALWGYECLARAAADDGSIIAPGSLLAWADQENLLFMFDRVCREKHIENAAAVADADDLNFLINFLPSVIYEPSVCLSTTFAAARTFGLSPANIIFEVVETENIDDRDFLRRILDEYRAAGFRVALDDLGSGSSGLKMLGDLSPDLIKIDRELVAKSVDSEMHRVICQSVVQLARSTGKMVLAEGVETIEEYRFFHGLGVDLYQGYLFGRPAAVPARVAEIAPL